MGRAETEADMFQPYGEKVYEYSRPAPGRGAVPLGEVAGDVDEAGGGEGIITYEVWHVSIFLHLSYSISHEGSQNVSINGAFLKATWETPGFREYHRRMQIFILLYIEAGSYINEEEDSWEFMVL